MSVTVTALEPAELVARQQVVVVASVVNRLLVVSVRRPRRSPKVGAVRMELVATVRLPYVGVVVASSLLSRSRNGRPPSGQDKCSVVVVAAVTTVPRCFSPLGAVRLVGITL